MRDGRLNEQIFEDMWKREVNYTREGNEHVVNSVLF